MRPPVLSAQAVLGADVAAAPTEGATAAAARGARAEDGPAREERRVRGGDRPPPLGRLSALLATHSYFSVGAGAASPTSLVRRAAELGYRYVGLTDALNVTGGAELFQAAHEHGLKALIGA